MFCEKCGCKTEEGWEFCKNCGNPLNKNPEPTTDKTIVLSDEMRKELLKTETKPQPPKSKDNFFKKNMGWLIAAGAVLLAAIVALIILLCRPHNQVIDLNDYVSLELGGYENRGTIDENVLPFDTDKLVADVLGRLPDKDYETDEERDAYYKDLSAAEAIIGAIKADFEFSDGSYSGNLKNGDRVKITVTADSAVFKKHGADLKNATFVRELIIGADTAALPDDSKISVLTHCRPNFSGFNGQGRASFTDETYIPFKNPSPTVENLVVTLKLTEISELYASFEITSGEKTVTKSVMLSVSKDSNLSNGDKITVSAEESDFDFLKEYGLSIAETSIDITVDGLQDKVEIDFLEKLTVFANGLDGEGIVELETQDYTIPLPHSIHGVSSVKMSVTLRREDSSYALILTVPDTDDLPGQTKTINVPLIVSKRFGLENGDVISISFWLEDIEELEKAGITVTPTIKEYEISGLDSATE